MIDKKIIEALFNIPTSNIVSNRYLRIMSCNNPIKNIYIFNLKSIKKYFNLNESNFEENIIYCTYKYDLDLHYNLLKNNTIKNYTQIKLNSNIINHSIHELTSLYYLLNNKHITKKIMNILLKYNLKNYKKVLQFCEIIDIDKNIYHSKILSRLLNLRKQIQSYKNNNLPKELLIKEINTQKSFLNKHLNIIQKYNLYSEDFIIYTILFDIKHNNNFFI